MFDLTFNKQVESSSKEELFTLLKDLHGKTGRTAEIMRKRINRELIKRY